MRALLVVCSLAGTVSLTAQPCSPAIQVQTDSLRAETFRSAGVRKTVVRRLATRLDTLALRCDSLAVASVADITVGLDYLTTGVWASGRLGSLVPTGPTIVCATVVIGGVTYMGDRAVEVTYITQDSLAWVERPERDGSGLYALCLPVLSDQRYQIHPVRWVTRRVLVADLAVSLPLPEPVIP